MTKTKKEKVYIDMKISDKTLLLLLLLFSYFSLIFFFCIDIHVSQLQLHVTTNIMVEDYF